MNCMKFAVIAAGEGSRLSNEGVEVPKPLVRVCGEPLIDRLLSTGFASPIASGGEDHAEFDAQSSRHIALS